MNCELYMLACILTSVCKFHEGGENVDEVGEREGVMGVGKRELYMGSERRDEEMGHEF